MNESIRSVFLTRRIYLLFTILVILLGIAGFLIQQFALGTVRDIRRL